MATNLVRKPPQPPPYFTKSAISIIQDAKRLVEQSRQANDRIVQIVQPEAATFATVMLPLAHAENSLKRESKILRDYQKLSPDRKLRDASKEASRLLADLDFENFNREDLFKLVDAVVKKNEHLDPESKTLLQMRHRAYSRRGMHLPPLQRERLKEIRQRKLDLHTEFWNVPVDPNASMFFRLEELRGVPEDVISSLERGESENEDMLKVPYSYSVSSAIMQYASNGQTRKRYIAGRLQLPRRKEEIFKEIVLLRDEAARLLGYPNHAAFMIEERVAKTPETVDAFLADLREKIVVAGAKELEVLRQLKEADLESHGESFDGRFYNWDRRYYERMLLETGYSVDGQKIAEYFPLRETVSGMLSIFESLFHLAFEEIVGEEREKATVWQEDVRLFTVWDSNDLSSGFLGYLYLDLYQRENKCEGVSNFNLQPVCPIAHHKFLK
jgi:metallopeptidase MepB